MIIDHKVNDSFTFTLIDLYEDPDLAWVLELVPESWYANLEIDPESIITVSVDGKVHVNALLKEQADLLRAKVHLAWHGSINIQMEGMPSIVLDLKNAQLMVDGYIPEGDLEATDLKVSFHINGDLSSGEEVGLDIGTHLLLKIDDRHITQLKVWVPDMFCLVQSE